MKNFYTILLAVLTLPVGAQTLNVKTGQVTYRFNSDTTGDMPFTDGTTLTIVGKTFPIADITNIVINETAVADSNVSVRARMIRLILKSPLVVNEPFDDEPDNV